ncbi:MAG TPA: hypothetical protein VE869_08625 [Gemmatimonas sp.]|nr:hypothetical protein [Gemmatimonas sp.]
MIKPEEVARAGRSVWRYVAGASLLSALGFLSYQVLMVPVHAVNDEAGCDEAYADARTRHDTLSVDFMSLPDSSARGVRQRCGFLRRVPSVLPVSNPATEEQR